MAITVTKEQILSDDIEFGLGTTEQARGGNQLNSSYLPYSISESVTDALDNRYTSVYIDANFASLNGNIAITFSIADGVANTDAVSVQQLATKADTATLDTKADKNNVLELDNNDSYTPLFDYNPSSKKYVDDSLFTAFQLGVTGSFTAGSGENVTVVNGLIVGII